MSKNQTNGEKVSSPHRQSGQEKNCFVQVPLEVLEAGISTSAMKLYLILLKYARQSNECWPSQQTLGWDMNLKPRRIADLLKELEAASLVTIISRAKEGLSNLYQLLKVVPPKGGSDTSTPKTAEGAAKKDLPGKQKTAREGMQNIADESHAVEKHALKTHIHMQSLGAKHVSKRLGVSEFHRRDNSFDVCDLKDMAQQKTSALAVSVEEKTEATIHIPLISSNLERVKSILKDFGISEIRTEQLAPKVIRANLGEEYVRGLVEWIVDQAAFRTIYNPAGLLVQMVHQLAPVPIPRGVGVPTLNSLQSEAKAKSEYFEKHLPRLIAIEERNLANALSQRDRTSIKARLDNYLALQAKEEKERAYPVGKSNLEAPGAMDNPLGLFMNQSHLQNSAQEGRFSYATTD